MWSAVDLKEFADKRPIIGRLKYMLTPMALIDLIAILPFYLSLYISFDLRFLRVVRMLEARGLDVTPGIMARFEKLGDRETVAVLRIILDEEVGHVEYGSRWFAYLCQQRGLAP